MDYILGVSKFVVLTAYQLPTVKLLAVDLLAAEIVAQMVFILMVGVMVSVALASFEVDFAEEVIYCLNFEHSWARRSQPS